MAKKVNKNKLRKALKAKPQSEKRDRAIGLLDDDEDDFVLEFFIELLTEAALDDIVESLQDDDSYYEVNEAGPEPTPEPEPAPESAPEPSHESSSGGYDGGSSGGYDGGSSDSGGSSD